MEKELIIKVSREKIEEEGFINLLLPNHIYIRVSEDFYNSELDSHKEFMLNLWNFYTDSMF